PVSHLPHLPAPPELAPACICPNFAPTCNCTSLYLSNFAPACNCTSLHGYPHSHSSWLCHGNLNGHVHGYEAAASSSPVCYDLLAPHSATPYCERTVNDSVHFSAAGSQAIRQTPS